MFIIVSKAALTKRAIDIGHCFIHVYVTQCSNVKHASSPIVRNVWRNQRGNKKP